MQKQSSNHSAVLDYNVSIPLELVEDTLELLLNPKRIISSSDEIVLDWHKRTIIYQKLFDIVKNNMQSDD